MRWLTSRFETPAEAAQRTRTIATIDEWWRSFRAAIPRLNELFSPRNAQNGMDLPHWMAQHLGAIDDRLMWEFGPALKEGRHRLVITPESARHLRPLCDEILRRAPACEFEFYGERPPESIAEGLSMARSRNECEILVTGIECRPGKGNRVDLNVTANASASSHDLDRAWSQAIIICSTWLGEAVTDRWLGYIDVSASSTCGPALETLHAQFESAVNQCLRARHPRPYLEVAASSQWSIVELKPNPGQEITRRSDLFVYRTMDLGVADTLFRRLPFYSDRFSSHGERFCYLMLDGKGASMEGFEDKSQIEDALDAALTQQGLGAVMGSGTGLRYSYIDLALSNLDNASDTIIQVLRQGGIVTNAWLLFHDDEWHDEWIGIHDDTPAPPPA
jgi:hypothetical protein